ncbi:MAG: RDD family protein [Bilophila wadsworthia]|uniref:RDD family protein n=1 Tax=Bilophila wadsworthia TaxID=35833 RepID=UPI002432F6C7|nr:RDD family protein [Bilophila wadsworthia]MCI6538665.1 RDD family protein [Bilophila wadsworthia]
MKTAPIRKRIAALAINCAISFIVYLVLTLCNSQGLSFSLGLIIGGWLLFALFAAILGGTPGDIIMGIRLVDLNKGEKIKIVRASFRALFSLFSIGLCGMGYALMYFHNRRQALHDLMTNTIAVEIRQTSVEDLTPQRPAQQ